MLRYLRGTTQYGLWYIRVEGVKLKGFSDLGSIFSVGSTTIFYYNKNQRYVVLNSAQVEYMVANQETCEVIYMSKILMGLFNQEMDWIMIYCDNKS